MANPKLPLTLSEENEIGFQLSIEGTDREIASSKPKIRFVVTEEETGKGWIFNAEKGQDDGIAVAIPVMKGLVSENLTYSGKLEVILGGRYFTPTEVDIEFIEPLKVEAAIVNKSSKKTEHQQQVVVESTEEEPEVSVTSAVASVVTSKPKQTAVMSEEVKKYRVYSYADLTEQQKTEVNEHFLKKCRQLDPKNFATSTDVAHYMKEGTSYTKKRLKALMANATKEYIDLLNS